MSKPAEDAVERFEQGLAGIAAGFGESLAGCADEASLRAAAAKLIGPSGEVTQLLKLMPSLPGNRRKEFGQRANELKRQVQEAVDGRLAQIERALLEADLRSAPIDPSLPGRGLTPGRPHPIHGTIDMLLGVFGALGFEITEAPEIDLAEFNFTRLGFPPDHPATDMQDSFFIQGHENAAFDQRLLLRTHTSNAQVHEMSRRRELPVACVSAGKVFRRDDDATHSPMFHQIEGFWIDRGVSFAHLKGVLTTFVRRMFDPDAPVRFRPSYFPFVEPGGELDMGCAICRPWVDAGSPEQIERTAKCRVCKGTGWVEVLGCGMIHPVVFEHCGWDPNEVTGFAFGMGIERTAMLRHGIDHIGVLFDNDMRFLTQL